MKNKAIKYWPLAIPLVIVVLDRFAQALAVAIWQTKPLIISSWLDFTFFANKNMAFSLPVAGDWLSWIIAIILLVLGVYFISNWHKFSLWQNLALTSIIIGGISNLLDRVQYGYVIDYIEIRFLTVFNLSDALITGGIIIMLLNLKRSSLNS